SGFWSVSKVIERQILEEVTAQDLQHKDFGIRAEPSDQRPSLALPSAALFAWSEILDNAVSGTSKRLLKALARTTGKADPAESWQQWAQRIDQGRPELLVLLSHTVED